MSESEKSHPLTAREFALRKYEANLRFWKVIIGTAAVGVVGATAPALVQYYGASVENQRKKIEIEIAEETAHQEYVKDFLRTALDQDIELRIRFAQYFANVSSKGFQSGWAEYLERLENIKLKTQNEINILERKRIELSAKNSKNTKEQIDKIEIERKLEWLYTQVGYIQKDKSSVESVNQSRNTRCAYGNIISEITKRDTSLEKLHPDFRRKVMELQKRLITENIPMKLFEGFRSPQRQCHLYSKGRTGPGNIVTQAAPWWSAHQYGLAADFVRFENGSWNWNNETTQQRKDWERYHEIAQEIGLETIAWEIHHVQIPGISVASLASGNIPAGDESWAENMIKFINAYDVSNEDFTTPSEADIHIKH